MSGCGLVYKPVGHVLNRYAEDEALPYALSGADLDLTSCGTALSLNQLVGSFGRVVERPARTLIGLNTLAALCSDARAQQIHLDAMRALRAGRLNTARDARIVAQRLERRTALRRSRVYADTVRVYGELGAGCPALDADDDRLQYLVGILTSLQGLLSDIQAGGSVGIPQDVAARSARAADCLDSDRWWGVPNALQAVVWLYLPGNAPAAARPWMQLREAAVSGETQGMALAAMLYAVAAFGQSDTRREEQAIAQVARIHRAGDAPRDYALLNEVAFSQALYLSDRLWIEDTGHRTPLLALGRFPGDHAAHSGGDIDIGGLLD